MSLMQICGEMNSKVKSQKKLNKVLLMYYCNGDVQNLILIFRLLS